MQGICLTNIYLKMNISHILDIVEHTWKATITGHLIRSNIECIQIDTGSDSNNLNSHH